VGGGGGGGGKIEWIGGEEGRSRSWSHVSERVAWSSNYESQKQ